MKMTLTAAAALGAAIFLLAGCAAGPIETAPDDTADTPDTTMPTTEPEPAGVCDVLTADDVSAQLGIAVGEGSPRTGQSTANDVEWTTNGCGWESAEGAEVRATVALAEDFPAGFECVSPGSTSNAATLEGLGTQAWWTWDDFQGGEGVVIVCGDDNRVEVEVTGPSEGPVIDETSTRTGATTLATTLLESLPQ